MQFYTRFKKIRNSISLFILIALFLGSCSYRKDISISTGNNLPANILDFTGTPSSASDRSSLAFSDQGAWFAFGFPDSAKYHGGFSGPFLMTQGNGVWAGPVLSQLKLVNTKLDRPVDWGDFTVSYFSYNSHLEQIYKSEQLKITQLLFYSSPHTAVMTTRIENISTKAVSIQPSWTGSSWLKSLHFNKDENKILIRSEKSDAKGYIQLVNENEAEIDITDSTYRIKLIPFKLKPGESSQQLLSQSFIFPEHSFKKEQQHIENLALNSHEQLQKRIIEKESQLQNLFSKTDNNWQSSDYKNLLAKTVLTLQNNWRIPAGELKHSGLFPSYHYFWFHGFWAWDSWKHAVALAQFDTELAKEQIKTMYDFQTSDGFIPDCIYRDTTIENHNRRNTKPPLSAWAVWAVYQQDNDLNFLNELYPKILKQHLWWYINRDHDQDGICEYGSADGTLIAAKWESGMDNAVRFDESQILKNSETAFSLNQESVDLNSYLYAEKILLAKIATAIQIEGDAQNFKAEAETLKLKIQEQFFDARTGWFYDTSIDGKTFINVKGCEGWIPLWTKVATPKQAQAVKNNMIDPEQFFTKVPFQTLTANHPKFKPDGGYWRGPNWLDQSYFGVVGLKNYGYQKEANEATYKLIHNAEGVLESGKSIRENYNPITGEGLESKNFSWSAAHYLLLLVDE